MAMNKAEKTGLEEARTIAALRWSAPVERDVTQPKGGSGSMTTGWEYNAHSLWVEQMWSTSVSHGSGPTRTANGSASQRGRDLFSTKLLALKAMRHECERRAAKELRRIDQMIEAECAERL